MPWHNESTARYSQGSLSLRRHYPVQVIRVFLSFAKQSTPGDLSQSLCFAE